MKYISEREFNSKMRVIQRRNESIDRYNKLKDEKKKVSINIKKPTTDKLIAIYLFIILNVILCVFYDKHVEFCRFILPGCFNY